MSQLPNTAWKDRMDNALPGFIDSMNKLGPMGVCFQTKDQLGGLNFCVAPVNFMADAGSVEFAGSPSELAVDADDNFVYIDDLGALQITQLADFPLPSAGQVYYSAKIVTLGGAITEIHNFCHPSGGV